MHEVCIIGAGLSGVLIGHKIKDHIILEKSRGVGGRLASRRFGTSSINHGALHLTTPEGLKVDTPHQWIKELSEGLNIHKSVEVSHFEKKESFYQILCKDGQSFEAKKIILTAPAPQALGIIERSKLKADFLKTVQYKADIQFILHHKSKIDTHKLEELFELKHCIQINNEESLKLYHLKSTFIPDYLERDKEEIKITCQQLIEGEILDSHAHKWRYSEVLSKVDPSYQHELKNQNIYLAGDYFGLKGIRTSIESAEAIIRSL